MRGACIADVVSATLIAVGLLVGGAIGVAGAAEMTFALRVENGHVAPDLRLIRVQQNDLVKLVWTTDKPMTVHLHGYDVEKKIAPGTATEMSFTARATGRFTIEPHLGTAQSGGHAHGDVLVTIEVYP